MKFLECKIPPAFVFAITAVLMWSVFEYIPEWTYRFELRRWYFSGLFSIGVLIGIAGVFSFLKHKTTVDPHHPEKASLMIRSGIYQFTRNPMYLGLLVCLTGVAIYLANLLNIFLLIGFVLYMKRFQIIPEERALKQNFGDEYVEYKESVRRWI